MDMDKNMNTPPTGENEAEKIKKQRFVDFFKSYGFAGEEAEAFINSNKDDTERQRYVDILKSKPHPGNGFNINIPEFEANIIIDLCWDNLENREWIKKEKVIDLLKEKGLNDETKSLRDNWIVEQEILSFKDNTTEANIKINIETSEFNLVLGNFKEYFHDLESILDQADESGNIEIQDIIIAKIKEFQEKHNAIVQADSKNKLL